MCHVQYFCMFNVYCDFIVVTGISDAVVLFSRLPSANEACTMSRDNKVCHTFIN